MLQDVNKNVRSILNKITPDNMGPLTERFKALPIDTIDRLEKTIDLVFEKVFIYLCPLRNSNYPLSVNKIKYIL